MFGGDRSPVPVTPKTTPTNSPRPSPNPENLEINVEITDNNIIGFPEDSTGKPLNPDLTQADANKTENNLGTSIKEKKTKKKSSWFNSFYPTYKSRSEDFKRIFKEVPDEERLVVDYSCAVQKEILVHGRLYVTQNYLCFYANIFGWETNIVLKWKDVAAITKEKTALVIPNAILISTSSEKYFFTSFVARDKVYLMLFRVWQNALMDRQMSNQEMWKWVHHSYGAELGLTSDDEDYIAPDTLEDKQTKQNNASILHEGDNNIVEEDKNSKEKMQEERENLNNSQNSTNSKKRSTDGPASSDIDMSGSDFSDLEVPAQCDIENVCCTYPHDGRQIMSEVLPIHVDQLFTLLFTSSKFYLDFHASRKSTDLTQTPWVHDTNDNCKTRVVNQTVALTQPIGPKTSQVTQKQVILPCSKPGVLYSINSESTSAGVPYADSFCIEIHFCLKRVNEKQSSIEVYAQVKFKKSVWGLVKGMIEKNCWSGLEEFHASLSKALKVECEELVPDVKRKLKRKRKLQSPLAAAEAPVTNLGNTVQTKEIPYGVLRSEKVIYSIFVLLILLLVANIMLYRKLWSLEEESSHNSLYLQLLKNPPTTQDEWLKLLKKQERFHAEEVGTWQKSLRRAISALKQTEEILSTLQQSTTSRIMSRIKLDDNDTPTSKIEL